MSQLAGIPLNGLSLSFLLMLFPRHPKTSVPSAQVRRALERPLGNLYISKEHLSELLKDSWHRYVCIVLVLIFCNLCYVFLGVQMRTADVSEIEAGAKVQGIEAQAGGSQLAKTLNPVWGGHRGLPSTLLQNHSALVPPSLHPDRELAKEKSPRKSTPKKSATKNGNVAAADQNIAANVSPTVPNLRLEAKLRAEEDSRMSAGKQLHPFFSSWKEGKKNQEAAAAENGRCQSQGRDLIVTIGPIHVFDKFQDCNPTIDWKNWTFCEQTSTNGSPAQQIKFNSLEHRPKEFDLNEVPTLDVCVIDDEEPEQCASHPEGITETSPVVLIAYQEEKRGYLGSLDGRETDCEVYEAVELSDDAGGAADKSHELQSISCGER
uniref:Uncharacterized protein n=1 Tax=Noccaea caerulescens TaxID=107243 RepID=A0A1J3DXD2_NOCCA